MKIGFFDSGLGGLSIFNRVIKKLPDYDYLYLGDIKRMPYGSRLPETIYQFTKEALDFLFSQNCALIILACNTVSACALRRIQQEYLPKHYPQRRVLGVIVPTIEIVQTKGKIKRIGVLATVDTVSSRTFITELKKINSKIKIFQQPAPLLVPLIENNGDKWVEPILKEYLTPLLKKRVEAIILGCTHYCLLKNRVKKIVGESIKIISQDEIIPEKLENYLTRHPEIENKLTKNGKKIFAVTEITKDFEKTAKKIIGKEIRLKKVNLV